MWLELAVSYLPKVIKDAAWMARFLAWRQERDARRKAGGPPSIPPGAVAALLLAVVGLGCRTVGPLVADVAEYCQERPWECGGARPTPTPGPQATPTPVPAATSTATASPTRPPTVPPTAAPTGIPTAIPTAAPSPYAPPEGCLVRSSVPDHAVTVTSSGPCRPPFRRVDDPVSGAHGCVIYWHCADGNDAFNCPTRVSADLHFQNLTLGDPDGLIHDGEHPRVDAYCRRINADGAIIHPGLEPDGYQPEDWESATICRPFICPPTPAPTEPPPPVATEPPPGGIACSLPPGDGEGVDCPRTRPTLLADVDAAISRVIWAHPNWLEGRSEVVQPGHENDFRFAVVDDLRHAGFCAFFDGEEIAIKSTNALSEQYHIVSSAGNIRRGEGSYRATCVPAWKAIPATAAAPPPAPAPSSEAAPLLVLWRVGDDCSNPKTGNRYLVRRECVVGSTDWYRDPSTPADVTRDSSCDPQHLGWSTFCHQHGGLDPRGPAWTVENASWVPDETNPWQIVVSFEAGQAFTVCARPRDDFPGPVLRPAQQCRTQRHE
jgi:hypothetical protein